MITREPAQAGNRASKSGCRRQCRDNSSEQDAMTPVWRACTTSLRFSRFNSQPSGRPPVVFIGGFEHRTLQRHTGDNSSSSSHRKVSPESSSQGALPQGRSHVLRELEEARKLTSSREILLWMTPSEAPKALQASECSELLDPMRASCWIFAQH